MLLAADSIALFRLSGWPSEAYDSLYYVGSFNGDVSEFFELFKSLVGADRAVHLKPPEYDKILDKTRWKDSLLFLSGGDCDVGMMALANAGIGNVDHLDAVAGLSAGAMVLMPRYMAPDGTLKRGLGRIRANFLVCVHDEASDWAEARRHRHTCPILCIPSHSACMVEDDGHVLISKLNSCIFMTATETRELAVDIRFIL